MAYTVKGRKEWTMIFLAFLAALALLPVAMPATIPREAWGPLPEAYDRDFVQGASGPGTYGTGFFSILSFISLFQIELTTPLPQSPLRFCQRA